MKIAFPTNDELAVCSEFSQARGFLVITSELGEITREEMRWNKLSEILCSPDGILEPIRDCQAIMVHDIGKNSLELLKERNIEVVRTPEKYITNAWVHYLEQELRREGNTCCCP